MTRVAWRLPLLPAPVRDWRPMSLAPGAESYDWRDRSEEKNTKLMKMDRRKRSLALIVLCLGDLMIVLDTTIVNVALPSTRADLGSRRHRSGGS